MRNYILDHPVPMQDGQGFIINPGFARQMVWDYRHQILASPRVRTKEWDYYLVMTDGFAVAFTISDLGYLRMASVSFLDLAKGTDTTKTLLKMPAVSYTMPEKSSDETPVSWESKDMILRYEVQEGKRHVFCWWKNFSHHSDFKADLWFDETVCPESMNILTPWPDRKHFYLNQKINCMPVSGTITANWHVYHLDPEKDSGILDWGRGWWPYKIHWYWGTCSSRIGNMPFGFSIGYGFGDTSAASENVLFYNGQVHKLEDITFKIGEDPMEDWTITSSDGRFEAVFHPELDRANNMNFGVIKSDQHQYFGHIDGTVKLDNGKILTMDHLVCAFEDIRNQY